MLIIKEGENIKFIPPINISESHKWLEIVVIHFDVIPSYNKGKIPGGKVNHGG